MFDAQILINDSTGGLKIYSPWMQRGGDNATFTLEIVADKLSTSKTFVVTIFTKKSEEAGDGAALASGNKTITFTAGDSDTRPSVTTADTLEDLVRYEFKFGSTAAVDDWVGFRMLPPSWFDSVST